MMLPEYSLDHAIKIFVLLWAVVDPIGSVPVFIAVTKQRKPAERLRIATMAIAVAAVVLGFFILLGEMLLSAMEVPLSAFQISGGIILFLFALSMIFGDSKPEEEIKVVRAGKDTAIYPLALPSIASPGAIVAVVLLTDNSTRTVADQILVSGILLLVLFATWLLLCGASTLYKIIGETGASVISRVMGLILGAVAANNVLIGLKTYFR